MTEIIHFAGPTIAYDGVRRQRCLWCGALIDEHVVANTGYPTDGLEGVDYGPPSWRGFVAVDGPSCWHVPDPGAREAVPERACVLVLPDSKTPTTTTTTKLRPRRAS